jgi:hypothetical protein
MNSWSESEMQQLLRHQVNSSICTLALSGLLSGYMFAAAPVTVSEGNTADTLAKTPLAKPAISSITKYLHGVAHRHRTRYFSNVAPEFSVAKRYIYIPSIQYSKFRRPLSNSRSVIAASNAQEPFASRSALSAALAWSGTHAKLCAAAQHRT